MGEAYPVLTGEIARRGIKKSTMARRMGISVRSLYNKLAGDTEFTWPEVLAIHSCFFPDMEAQELFRKRAE